MTKTKLANIKDNVKSSHEHADRIMNGGENYDGADGAREVLYLCSQAEELIDALEASEALEG